MSDDSTNLSVRVDDDLNQAIADQLEYGDSKADWIREAIRQRLERKREESDEGNRTKAAD